MRYLGQPQKLNWKSDQDNGLGEYDFHYLDDLLLGVTKTLLPSEHSEPKDDDLWIFQISDTNIRLMADNKRFSSPWHWQLYTSFSQPESALSDDVWVRLKELADANDPKLKKAIESSMMFSSTGNSTIGDQLLERIQLDFEGDKAKNNKIWLLAIIDTADSIYPNCGSYGWLGSNNYLDMAIDRLFRLEFQRLRDVSSRLSLLKVIFNDAKSIWAISSVFRSEYYYANSKENTDNKEPVLTKEELEQVTKWYVKRIRNLSLDDFKNSPDSWSLMHGAQNALGDDNAKEWFQAYTKSDSDLVVACEGLEKIMSSAQTGKGIPNSWLSSFAEPEKIKIRLKKIACNSTDIGDRAKQLLEHWYMDKRW